MKYKKPVIRVPLPDTEDLAREVASWEKEIATINNPHDLLKFLRKLTNNYTHSSKSLCEAYLYAMLGAARLLSLRKDMRLGVEEVSAIMWGFIAKWMDWDDPIKLQRFSLMLFPNMEKMFDRVMFQEQMDWLQTRAKQLKEQVTDAPEEVVKHWDSIIAGTPPFGYSVLPSEALKPVEGADAGVTEGSEELSQFSV